MLERQLEYERVRLEAESRKADLELQEKVQCSVYPCRQKGRGCVCSKYVVTGLFLLGEAP